MPRVPRIYLEETLYYVTSKGDFNQPIFKDAEDYKMFLELVKKYKEQYKFKIFSYCLLPGHFHLLLEFPEQKEGKGVLSNVMHDLNSSYTKYFNGKYSRKGHLFRERYKATLAEKESYLLKVSAYIHLNPQRLGLSPASAEYPYSSYIYYLKKDLPLDSLIKEEKAEILSLLNGQRYEDFIEKIIRAPDFLNLHDGLRKGILGSKDFQDKVRQAFSVYKKEKVPHNMTFGQKLGVISFAAIFVLVGINIILKFTLEKKEKPAPVFSLSYKLPTQVKELLRDLENIEWQIRVISLPEGKVENDLVFFQEGKFISRNLKLKNFPPADYSLIIEDQDKLVWKAAQPGPDGEVSWRGEIKKGEMEGNFRLRASDGSVQDFSFIGITYRRKK